MITISNTRVRTKIENLIGKTIDMEIIRVEKMISIVIGKVDILVGIIKMVGMKEIQSIRKRILMIRIRMKKKEVEVTTGIKELGNLTN